MARSADSEDLICEVCKTNVALGVACSVWGPISFAYCRECLEAGRDDYGAMVGGMMGIQSKDALNEAYYPVVEATLAFYGKTWDDLFADIRTSDEELDRAMSGEE